MNNGGLGDRPHRGSESSDAPLPGNRSAATNRWGLPKTCQSGVRGYRVKGSPQSELERLP